MIVCGDAREVLAGMADESIDLIVTDPPYGIDYVSAWPKQPWNIHVPIRGDNGSIWSAWPELIGHFWRVLKPNSAVFIFTRWDQWARLDVSPLILKNMIVWDKMNHSAGDLEGNYGFAHELIIFAVKGRPKLRGRRIWNVWQVPRVPADRLTHPAEKPRPLLEIPIRTMSDRGDLVLDPFAGTCTTGMAAKMLGRNYLMIEIDEQWCRIGRRRVDAVQERML